jgi:S1-C subfamily serine protease
MLRLVLVVAFAGGIQPDILADEESKDLKSKEIYAEEIIFRGSGFIVSTNGYFVTCSHCTAGKTNFVITVGASRFYATVVGEDGRSDLALLRLKPKKTGRLPRPMPLRKELPEPGSSLTALGFTEEMNEMKSAAGTLLPARKLRGKREPEPQTQEARTTITWAGHGFSGGPLTCETGVVAGVNKAVSDSGNLLVAVPLDTLREFLKIHGVPFEEYDPLSSEKAALAEGREKTEQAIGRLHELLKRSRVK